MNCLDCGTTQICTYLTYPVEPSLASGSRSTHRERVWVCPECFPQYARSR